ncbi:HD domain-containing protein [Carboxydothermus pertinax]|uniref:HD domain-containing protein n=1 Tax=Carboxydothermus pertinax TaxID=870242 RepID=A0A1L8CWD3_9THEO|nr:HD domain-containing protein [Carboxydothermus pertinax]GAV23207.1 HD domain-containing protein [Carboxydothermus pertinax]
MDRFWRIVRDEEVVRRINIIADLEKEREFCRHDVQHFLDVARILHILNYENNLELLQELVYITAFLHDLGRVEEYQKGLDHAKIGVEIARRILMTKELFTDDEIYLITGAIAGHRNSNSTGFAKLLYLADKLSRPCLSCKVLSKCHKGEEMLLLHQKMFY